MMTRTTLAKFIRNGFEITNTGRDLIARRPGSRHFVEVCRPDETEFSCVVSRADGREHDGRSDYFAGEIHTTIVDAIGWIDRCESEEAAGRTVCPPTQHEEPKPRKVEALPLFGYAGRIG